MFHEWLLLLVSLGAIVVGAGAVAFRLIQR
jgi:hypothetical protein